MAVFLDLECVDTSDKCEYYSVLLNVESIESIVSTTAPNSLLAKTFIRMKTGDRHACQKPFEEVKEALRMAAEVDNPY